MYYILILLNFCFLFRFPSDEALKAQWVASVKRVKFNDRKSVWAPSPHDCICSEHFHQSDMTVMEKRTFLKRAAVPSIFSHNPDTPSSSRAVRYVLHYGHVPVVDNLQQTTLEQEYKDRIKRYRDSLRNAQKREKRLRLSVESLREDLKDEKLISKNLSARLEAFDGVFSLLKILYFFDLVSKMYC